MWSSLRPSFIYMITLPLPVARGRVTLLLLRSAPLRRYCSSGNPEAQFPDYVRSLTDSAPFRSSGKYRHIVADCQLKKLAACKIAPGRVPRRANSKQSRGLTCTCVTTFDGGPTRWVEELCMENVVEYPAAA